MSNIRITHRSSGTVLAEGPVGWNITPFEGNYYIRRKLLKTDRIRANGIPGFCPYKFLYVWMDFHYGEGKRVHNLAWTYWLPNPLLPFIWFRIALPSAHPDIEVTEY